MNYVPGFDGFSLPPMTSVRRECFSEELEMMLPFNTIVKQRCPTLFLGRPLVTAEFQKGLLTVELPHPSSWF